MRHHARRTAFPEWAATLLVIVLHDRPADRGGAGGRAPPRLAGSRRPPPAPPPRAGWSAPARATTLKRMSGHPAQPAASGSLNPLRLAPQAGRCRFQRRALSSALVADVSLVRERGAGGRAGTVRVRTLATAADARAAFDRALARRRRRGDRPRSTGDRGGGDGRALEARR